METLRQSGTSAIALTDQSNVFAAIKFYRAAIAAGIKPILGADVYLENKQKPQEPFSITLLCQNTEGYRHLMELISRSYRENQQQGKAILKPSWLFKKNAGLILLSGGLAGDIGQAILSSKRPLVSDRLSIWQTYFSDRFYLELQKIGMPNENFYNQEILTLARKHHVPIVATNPVRFLEAADFEAHEARVCINRGWLLTNNKRPQLYTHQQYLRSPDEMAELFSDTPEALQNTVEIAKRCNLVLTFGKTYLPEFEVAPGKTPEEEMEKLARKGLEERLSVIFDRESIDFEEKRKPYDERFREELKVINQMGFAGYFLIVADFVQWAKDNKIPVGPGRGSGSGSIVAYSLKITDLDPLHYHLLFERFLNPERVSMPDFDIDFCIVGRDRVIDYVAKKYGYDRVAQIITYGTMAARAVVRDVGRVLGHPYGYVDKIAKLIPFELGITLDKALEKEEQLRSLYEKDDNVKTLIILAKKLEGITRNVGKHAAGVVISPTKLTNFTALYYEPGETDIGVTQFDKDDLESAVGLVKFDFLGLKTLTVIDQTLQIVKKQPLHQKDKPIDLDRLPLDDDGVYELMKRAQTTGVFQFESRGMKDLIKQLQPDCFDDMIALVGLFRPGPLQSGMVDSFVKRKHGQEKISFIHPLLEKVLKPTYGVIIYQEQVMQIARILAGYSLGGADILRRAMGKKKPKVMEKQRKIFMKGAIANHIDPAVAQHIFDLMEKFSAYGFPQAHTTAYAIIAYQTAWLKVHYPAEFMAALLSSDMDNTDKLIHVIEECQSMKIKVKAPDINLSEPQFTVKNKQILYGLGALKGVGMAAAELILQNRHEYGEYKTIIDFCDRLDLRKVNRRIIEALVKSGAFDSIGENRASLFASIDIAIKAAEQRQKCSFGQADLFGMENNSSENLLTCPSVAAWPLKKKLQLEKEALGYYLSDHPIRPYLDELGPLNCIECAHLAKNEGKTVRMLGWVTQFRTMQTKRGDRMAFVTLSDLTGKTEVALFSDLYQTCRDYLKKDTLLLIEGEINADDYTGGIRVSAKRAFNLTQLREQFAKHLLIHLQPNQINPKIIHSLKKHLQKHLNGKCPVYLSYETEEADALIPLGEPWRVVPTDECLQALRDTFVNLKIEVKYV
jgi:DNA polymerase-3 subunit alpha